MNQGSKIPNAINVVEMGRKEQAGELAEVKPFIGGIFYRTIIEIESININIRSEWVGHKKQRPLFSGLAPCCRSNRGGTSSVYRSVAKSQ